jgi:hypothetical protein
MKPMKRFPQERRIHASMAEFRTRHRSRNAGHISVPVDRAARPIGTSGCDPVATCTDVGLR